MAAAALLARAWADHPGGPPVSAAWSPITAALVFGGLALAAGIVVVLIVAVLTRGRPAPPDDE